MLDPTIMTFWATQRGADLDLMIIRQGRRYGFEFKASDAPRLTPSMRIAMEDLGLEHLWMVFPASAKPYYLADKIEACPLGMLHERIAEVIR